jgi:hypothetical protein
MSDPIAGYFNGTDYTLVGKKEANEIAKQIRQQIGRELLKRTVWRGYTRYVMEDTLREVCKLEASDE